MSATANGNVTSSVLRLIGLWYEENETFCRQGEFWQRFSLFDDCGGKCWYMIFDHIAKPKQIIMIHFL